MYKMHRHSGHTGHVDIGLTYIFKGSSATIVSKGRGVGFPRKRALRRHRVELSLLKFSPDGGAQ